MAAKKGKGGPAKSNRKAIPKSTTRKANGQLRKR